MDLQVAFVLLSLSFSSASVHFFHHALVAPRCCSPLPFIHRTYNCLSCLYHDRRHHPVCTLALRFYIGIRYLISPKGTIARRAPTATTTGATTPATSQTRLG
jgi:hypothetical protein